MRRLSALVILFASGALLAQEQSAFKAVGPTQPVLMKPHQQAVVTVSFNKLPTSLRFNAPAYVCMVSENDIQYCNGFAETYDPRQLPNAVETSFEPAFDDDNKYARIWIESQNAARIVVRCRGALVSDEGKLIAHQDTPSRSPYGKGDWVDEWYYVYPDGLHARHVRIYTGLAAQSVPFGFDREPPRAIHEFMEAMVLGKAGRLPTDDIEANAVTLIKTIGQHSEDILRTGQARDFSYQLYPKDFAEFSDANIMLINLKSTYRPFTIGMPHGVRTQPYKRDVAGNGFQVWGNPPQTPYTVPLGHIINYGHHRKIEHILEQVYLSGWVHRDDDALKKIVPNCWAWTVPPKLIERPESGNSKPAYDPAQKAYIIEWNKNATSMSFDLLADLDYYGAPSTIVNPAFVVRNWDGSNAILKINDRPIKIGEDAQIGIERTDGNVSLVAWLSLNSDTPVKLTISKN